MGREHWVETTLGEIFELKYGKGLPKEIRIDGKINVYGSNGIVGNHDSAITFGETIILGRKGSVGEAHYSAEKCWPIDTTYYIDTFYGKLPAYYWYLFLKSISLCQHEKSSAIPGISRNDIYPLPLLMPPLNEQKRIVEKLDAILPKVKNAKTRLEKIPLILKKFRQSVLSAACSGRLTEEWREEKDLSKWKERALENLCQIISGNAFKSSDFTNKGVPVVKIANVQYGKFEDDTNQEYLPLQFQADFEKFIVHSADILLALTRPITNDSLKVCLYPEGRDNALVNQRVALLKPNSLISKEYLLLFMQSHDFKESIKNNLTETLQPNLSPKNLAKINILFPPLEEQQEIVRRIEKLFALADSLEAKYKKAIQRVEKIEQSVLAKAFKGELADPDPSDEPAADLLNRILEEKAKLKNKKKKPRSKRSVTHY